MFNKAQVLLNSKAQRKRINLIKNQKMLFYVLGNVYLFRLTKEIC